MVGLKLRKIKSHHRRNKDLTKAFIISFTFWIVLWLPRITSSLLRIFHSRWQDPNSERILTSQLVAECLAFLDWDLFLLQTLVNPAIFVFVSRAVQKPMKRLLNIIHK